MRAKSFFYVCAGILMLAVAYQLGALRAEAQSGPILLGVVGRDQPTGAHRGAALDSAGQLYWRDGQGEWQLAASQAPPGTPVDFFQNAEHLYYLAMANGDVYTLPGGTNWAQPFQFTFLGNVFGGGTISVDPTTLGDVKGKYRDEE